MRKKKRDIYIFIENGKLEGLKGKLLYNYCIIWDLCFFFCGEVFFSSYFYSFLPHLC
jgi:hypothetical protein